MSRMTVHQQAAVVATGNILVVAGAGAGKTSTLVERCLHFVLNHALPVSLDEILMVTFTDAAAAEMRQRIREALEQRRDAEPTNVRLEEQLALLDTADICTLHSYCLRLVRQHFHELALDPQLKVLPAEEARQLAAEALDDLLQMHYRGTDETALAVQHLIQEQAGGWDQKIRELVMQLHHYTQTLADPAGWLTEQRVLLAQAEPTQWRGWLREAGLQWLHTWLPILEAQPVENKNAAIAFAALRHACTISTAEGIAKALAEAVELARPEHWPHGSKGKFRTPIEGLFEEAAYLHSLTTIRDGIDPLVQDWDWVRGHLLTLTQLMEQFTTRYASAKRELAALDFHDLEQMSLRLLWDNTKQAATPLAEHLRARLKLVFVDEYQDINAAQDAILRALSQEGEAANRFLVGDVKQSIYRFRLADPRIFQKYDREWRASGDGRVIPLADNFRSHEGLLEFINPFFAALMRPEIGGVIYDEEARLRFGNREGREALTLARDSRPRVEVHLRITTRKQADDEENGSSLAELTKGEQEAQVIGRRLKALHSEGHLIWDKASGTHRPVKWSDMVILLRSVKSKAESYAKVFHRLGVPLQAARSGFYECTEVSDVLSLLTLLDNPLQDVPVLAVLRSPLVGLSVNELAEVRLAQKKTRYWQALQRWHAERRVTPADFAQADESAELFSKVDLFLRRYRRWRGLARRASLSQQMETILSETHYLDWLAGQPRGGQLTANVQQLLALARQFDQFQQQGLYRFLKLVEAEREAESSREPAAPEAEDAVRLTSIHQSKGLEYPVVVLGSLDKRFNLADTQGTILLDEEYGLSAMVKPPNSGQRYPSLPLWLAKKRQRRESLGEEIRLFYVALTRARDTLILAGAAPEQTAVELWPERANANPPVPQLLRANNFMDWLGPWVCHASGEPHWAGQEQGTGNGIQWFTYRDQRMIEGSIPTVTEPQELPPLSAAETTQLMELKVRLAWQYPYEAATVEPAKTSVSAWRRRWMEDEEARPFFRMSTARREIRQRIGTGRLTAAEIGTAHHLFFQFVELDQVQRLEQLQAEADRLADAGVLQADEIAALDLPAMLDFWSSELGRRIQSAASQVHRELPFTTRLAVQDFFRVAGTPPKIEPDEMAELEQEFIVVQGVVDLAVITPREILLVDFKTDAIDLDEMAESAKFHEPQLRLYTLALENIYQRKVTGVWLHFLSLHRSVLLG